MVLAHRGKPYGVLTVHRVTSGFLRFARMSESKNEFAVIRLLENAYSCEKPVGKALFA